MRSKLFLIMLVVLCFSRGSMAELSEPVIFIDLSDSVSGQGNLIYSYVQTDVFHCGKCRKVDLSEGNDTKQKQMDCTSDRLIGGRGQKLKVTVKHPSRYKDIQVTFEETTRKTKISSDFTVLMKLDIPVRSSKIKYSHFEYILTKRRANLKVSLSYIPDSTKSNERKSLNHEIITGPTEHWFLSADLPVSKVSQVKYDAEANSIREKESPSVFYLGVNFMIGDVLSEHLSLWDRIIIKGMLKISTRPLDSYGVALGYRLPYLDQLSLFAGTTWTKADVMESGGMKENGKCMRKCQFGISYDIGKALDWVKK